MIEPHLFIFAFQNYICVYISQQHRATGGSWSITTAGGKNLPLSQPYSEYKYSTVAIKMKVS